MYQDFKHIWNLWGEKKRRINYNNTEYWQLGWGEGHSIHTTNETQQEN